MTKKFSVLFKFVLKLSSFDLLQNKYPSIMVCRNSLDGEMVVKEEEEKGRRNVLISFCDKTSIKAIF